MPCLAELKVAFKTATTTLKQTCQNIRQIKWVFSIVAGTMTSPPPAFSCSELSSLFLQIEGNHISTFSLNMSYFQPGNLVQADFWVYGFCWLCQLFDKPVLNGKSNDVSDMLSIWQSVFAVARAQRSHCMLRVGLSIPGPHGQSHCAHSTVPPRNCVTVWLLKEVSNFLNYGQYCTCTPWKCLTFWMWTILHMYTIDRKSIPRVSITSPFFAPTIPFFSDFHEQCLKELVWCLRKLKNNYDIWYQLGWMFIPCWGVSTCTSFPSCHEEWWHVVNVVLILEQY